MESPADNKRTAALALAVLGLLMVGALLVLVVFNGDDDTSGEASENPAATSAAPDGNSGGGSAGTDGKPADDSTSGAGTVKPIISPEDAAKAHKLMTDYMVGLNTYAHTDDNASWSGPLLDLTTGDAQLRQDTALPTGKAWDTCVAAKCASRGQATVVRDAMVADDLVNNSGITVSSLVKATATRSENGRNTVTETNSWLVTVQGTRGGSWKVSNVSIYGLGNVGVSDQAGG